MNARMKTVLAVAAACLAAQAIAQVTFYEREAFAGRTFTTNDAVENLWGPGFNDLTSSIEVFGGRWEICEDLQFGGRCVILRPGRYPTLAAMGMNDRVSSTRPVSRDERIDDRGYAPPPVASPDFRRRKGERLYEAKVISVRAIFGAQEKRCWIEHERLGAVRDSGGPQWHTRDVQRCTDVPNQRRPDYWDVVYIFRGQENRVQTATPPGPTIIVNQRGEPRY